MTVKRLLSTLAFAFSAVGVHAAAEPLVLVAGYQSPLQRLSSDEAAALYLGERAADTAGHPITVYDLADEDLRQSFYRQVTGRSLSQIRAYWAKRVFTGNGRPPPLLPMDKLIEQLQANPAAIAYLPASRVNGLRQLVVLHP